MFEINSTPPSSVSRVWWYRGEQFLLEVKRVDTDKELVIRFGQPKYKWLIYIYLFPKHPMFSIFDKATSLSNCYADNIPELEMHGGITYFSKINTDGALSIKIGCDYCHYMDDAFDTKDSPEVFKDAEELFNKLCTK